MVEMNKEDQELAEIFHGEEKPLHPDTVHVTLGKPASKPVPKKQEATKEEKSIKDQWEPAKPAPGLIDKLKDCVKWMFLFGGLSCLVFYWKETGLMAESIAVPSIAVCTALAGWGVGKNAR